MAEVNKKRPHIISQIVLILIWVIFLIILILLKTNSAICEWWTRNPARWYETAIGSLFKWVPFSLTEVIIVTLVIIGVILLIKFIIDMARGRFLRGISKLLSVVLTAVSIATVYQATAEMAYNRERHPVTFYEEKVDKT